MRSPGGKTASGKTFPAELLFELEELLGRTPMFGVPLGGLLNDVVIIDLINGQGRWSAALRLRWFAGHWRLRMRGAFRPPMPRAANGHILVTWRAPTPRLDGLLMPVIEELGPERCTVMYEKESVVPRVPRGAAALRYFAVVPHEPDVWRPEFLHCWPAWKAALNTICRRYGLSSAVLDRLAIELVHGSQIFVGCRQFLQAFRPAAVVTEYDRGVRWSCLVLAARSLDIPTFTLQHGVIGERAIGYAPLLADKIFCWGETSRDVLAAAGVPSERILIGGCPRLDRQLAASPAEGRGKLGLDSARPVVMLATAPYAEPERVRLVEMFAGCMERLPKAAGIVRLHPSEKLDDYRDLAAAHRAIRFFDNSAATLDESLAAADVVVVHNSGVGGDVLVKRRVAVVVDLPPAPLGYGRDLVDQAHCPCVQSADELLAAVRTLLFEKSAQQRYHTSADPFVDRFCAHFGRDAARTIANSVMEAAAAGGSAVQTGRLRPAAKQEATA